MSDVTVRDRNAGKWLIGAGMLFALGMVAGASNRVAGLNPAVNLLHILAVVLGSAILGVVTLSRLRRMPEADPSRTILVLSSLAVLVQAGLGAASFECTQCWWLTGVHYGLSVLVLTGVTTAALRLVLPVPERSGENPIPPIVRKAILTFGLVLGLLISGVFLAQAGISLPCAAWPLCVPKVEVWRIETVVWILHPLAVAMTGIGVWVLFREGWRTQRDQPITLPVINGFATLFLGQIFIGAMIVQRDAIYLAALHGISAASIVVTGALLVHLLRAGYVSIEPERLPVTPSAVSQRVRDFIAINKPIVVSLLLATTLAGMVMGAGGLPDLSTLVVTMIAGALAAGGASAVNQYLDRDVDSLMTRTAKRPIPAGRLQPAEGLAYGVAALLTSFFLLAGLVNILAAVLALAGMVYYVWFYSILLKRRSDQNIVIGGGAGAIPPMVGWAAATGSLDLTALFLFVLIFLWTPPHFWALALTRKNEYATAGIPMMPVSRGEEITRRLIFQYTLVLVAVSLIGWVLGLAGWIYLAAAIVLGVYMVTLAWGVLKQGRNKTYYRMYRHSNYYLLLLFIFLAVDSTLL
jgi:protoheme IX farnesyltransferase